MSLPLCDVTYSNSTVFIAKTGECDGVVSQTEEHTQIIKFLQKIMFLF